MTLARVEPEDRQVTWTELAVLLRLTYHEAYASSIGRLTSTPKHPTPTVHLAVESFTQARDPRYGVIPREESTAKEGVRHCVPFGQPQSSSGTYAIILPGVAECRQKSEIVINRIF